MEDLYKAPLKKLVDEICATEGILDPLISYSTSDKKKGFVSLIVKIQITGKNKQLHLVAKCTPSDEAFCEKIMARELFINEIKFYNEVMPAFLKFQERCKAKEPFNSITKFYGFSDVPRREILILEDLFQAGYKLRDSLVPMDNAHLEFVIKEYGRYHALSHALKYHDKESYQELTKKLLKVHEKFSSLDGDFCNLVTNSFKSLMSLYDKNEQQSPKIEALAKVCDNVRDIYRRVISVDEHSVIFHGDSWCNNMMFKYDDESDRPTSMKFLDFQLVSPGSAALDISYFLMANSPPECIKKVDHYLKLYHDSLSKHLRSLGCDPEALYPYAVLLDQWKKHSLYGMLYSITALKFAMASPEETPDIVNDFENCTNFNGENIGEYKKRADAIIGYYYDAKII